jgi:hypothetical protein
MKNNEISNKQAPTFAFRVEDFLVEYKDKSIKDKVLNAIVGKEKRASINMEVFDAMSYIFRHTDMSVDLVCERKKFTSDIENLLQHIPYNRVILINKPVEIAVMLNIGDITYYVDDNTVRMSIIGHKDCITLDQLNILIRGRI